MPSMPTFMYIYPNDSSGTRQYPLIALLKQLAELRRAPLKYFALGSSSQSVGVV